MNADTIVMALVIAALGFGAVSARYSGPAAYARFAIAYGLMTAGLLIIGLVFFACPSGFIAAWNLWMWWNRRRKKRRVAKLLGGKGRAILAGIVGSLRRARLARPALGGNS